MNEQPPIKEKKSWRDRMAGFGKSVANKGLEMAKGIARPLTLKGIKESNQNRKELNEIRDKFFEKDNKVGLENNLNNFIANIRSKKQGENKKIENIEELREKIKTATPEQKELIGEVIRNNIKKTNILNKDRLNLASKTLDQKNLANIIDVVKEGVDSGLAWGGMLTGGLAGYFGVGKTRVLTSALADISKTGLEEGFKPDKLIKGISKNIRKNLKNMKSGNKKAKAWGNFAKYTLGSLSFYDHFFNDDVIKKGIKHFVDDNISNFFVGTVQAETLTIQRGDTFSKILEERIKEKEITGYNVGKLITKINANADQYVKSGDLSDIKIGEKIDLDKVDEFLEKEFPGIEKSLEIEKPDLDSDLIIETDITGTDLNPVDEIKIEAEPTLKSDSEILNTKEPVAAVEASKKGMIQTLINLRDELRNKINSGELKLADLSFTTQELISTETNPYNFAAEYDLYNPDGDNFILSREDIMRISSNGNLEYIKSNGEILSIGTDNHIEKISIDETREKIINSEISENKLEGDLDSVNSLETQKIIKQMQGLHQIADKAWPETISELQSISDVKVVDLFLGMSDQDGLLGEIEKIPEENNPVDVQFAFNLKKFGLNLEVYKDKWSIVRRPSGIQISSYSFPDLETINKFNLKDAMAVIFGPLLLEEGKLLAQN